MIIYTVIIDGYDKVLEPEYKNDCRYILFTNTDIKSDFWEVIKVKGSGVKLSRDIKINFHKYLPEHDKSLYIDANINQLEDADFDYDSDMIAMKHPARDCIYDEMNQCYYRNKDTYINMTPQVTKYMYEGYPSNNGLLAAGVMFRKNNQKVIALMELWWSEVEKGSHRDQLSFNYCLWKSPINLEYMVYSKGFKINKHEN